jgi:hypothetical protein
MHAKTISLLKAIDLAEQFGVGRVIFSTECLGLQHAIISTSQDRARIGILFREAKYLLSLGFSEYQVIFKPRYCNKPTHVLANFGARETYGNHAVWFTDFPLDVTRAVADNMIESTS